VVSPNPKAHFVSNVFYPKVRVADYYTLRSGPDMDLPETYHEWRDLQAEEMRQIILNGDTPVEVEVDPDEFAEYCKASRHARTFDRLKQFVAEKGDGR
jgi:hypothetical protein